ncbi:RNA polymerase Rpb3/Rpb11 dimerization domain [Popillia japonica]|uniref:DNA-directed RNA polymerases I and III subunit RPAC1 n=1 Tax=Popillia japonica TaxID=7064 RepID=A0AAW1N4D7_POPJA
MDTINDEKPRVVLKEHKIIPNMPTRPTIFDDVFDIKVFKKKFSVVIVRYEHYEMEFDLIGIHPSLVNAFRRLILSDVPSMAIEKVHIYNNTTIIQDEVLAHRLGLIPLKADPRLFEYHTDEHADYMENDSLEFELKIKCTFNKELNNSSYDLYKNNNVYSKHIKWLPKGNQSKLLKGIDVGPIHDDILIAKMRPGHELDLKLIAVKSCGRDHAKFSPVATAFYRLLPDIRLVQKVEGEAAERLQKCFSPGVIEIEKNVDGKQVAKVKNARYDMSSRNVYRYDDLKDSVILSKVQDHFIFTVESVGAMASDVIFKEAVHILKNKCLSLLEELQN